MVKLPLLVQVFSGRVPVETLTLQQWDLVIRQARASMLLGRLSYFLENKIVPNGVWCHLQSAKVHSNKQVKDLFWEVRHLKKVADQLGFPLILLKGAAYAVSGHPAAKGRLFSDIDLLVSRENIPVTEGKLMMNGWIGTQQSAYDQRYYRQWMHEIPPIQHVFRKSVIDLHHNILPLTAAICPDARLLIDRAKNVVGQAGIQTLQPIDMIIHSASHLFYDGELEHGLRDLLDLDCLIRTLDDGQGELVERAFQLGLQRPLFYAVHYLTQILDTPISLILSDKIKQAAPNTALLIIMDFLFLRALMPDHPSCDDRWTGLARWLLYIRSHYLRMPLYSLIPHLLRKTWLRLTGKEQH